MARPKCPNCATETDFESVFCPVCGTPLAATPRALPAAAPRRTERRPLTVLFCDLVGSVALANTLDPEDMMHVLDVFRRSCEGIIARHNGYAARFIGDGVLAYFGYPSANEEDASHAVRAALALRGAMANLPLPNGITCQVRIGVATGLVVISDLLSRGEIREVDVIGETPNLAARLQSAAPAGGIVVAEATQRITAGLFTYRPLEPLTLKGFDAPVQAFEALDTTGSGSRSRARAESARTPAFGRDRELRLLVDRWSKARAGEGQVVLLRGEAGIGKSHLVEALRHHVADAPHLQFTWNCGPNTTDSALYPVAEQLARLAGFERGESAEARHAKLARLMARLGQTSPLSAAAMADFLGLPPAPSSPLEGWTPDKLKTVTLDSLLACLDAWTGREPTLLAIEDLHWSDPTTLELLDRIAAMAKGRSWMIVATARPEFSNRWSDDSDLLHIELTRLDRGAAERICAYFDAAAALPPDASRQIVARCDGIPLFVEEMTKSVLEGIAAAPARQGDAKVFIPATLHDSLVARLDRLGPARRIANVGATIGRRFSYDLLAEVMGAGDGELTPGLLELIRSGLIETHGPAPHSEYLFKHALIRDAAYESVLMREREALHRQIATVLRDRFPELQEKEPELLAHHLTRSGATHEAIPLWVAAGQRAASRATHVEAVAHLETAVELLRRQPPGAARAAAELPLLLGLAVSLSASRGYAAPEVGKVLAEARVICDAMGNVPELFAVLRNACSFYIVAVEMGPASETARLCLEMASKTGSPEQRIESQYAQGYVLYMRGELAEARQHLENAGELYRQHNGAQLVFPSPQDPYVGSLCALMMVIDGMGDEAGADRVEQELEAHVLRLGRDYDRAYCLCFQALRASARRSFVRLRARAEEALTVCNERSYPLYGAIASFYKGVAIGHLEDADAGLHMAMSAFDALDRIGCKLARVDRLHDIGRMRMAMGDLGDALSVIDVAIADSISCGEIFSLPRLRRTRAELVERTGRLAPVMEANDLEAKDPAGALPGPPPK
jgi:class 3 adenylate cyclase/tetratricopeptide (TPR) repeat protein